MGTPHEDSAQDIVQQCQRLVKTSNLALAKQEERKRAAIANSWLVVGPVADTYAEVHARQLNVISKLTKSLTQKRQDAREDIERTDPPSQDVETLESLRSRMQRELQNKLVLEDRAEKELKAKRAELSRAKKVLEAGGPSAEEVALKGRLKALLAALDAASGDTPSQTQQSSLRSSLDQARRSLQRCADLRGVSSAGKPIVSALAAVDRFVKAKGPKKGRAGADEAPAAGAAHAEAPRHAASGERDYLELSDASDEEVEEEEGKEKCEEARPADYGIDLNSFKFFTNPTQKTHDETMLGLFVELDFDNTWSAVFYVSRLNRSWPAHLRLVPSPKNPPDAQHEVRCVLTMDNHVVWPPESKLAPLTPTEKEGRKCSDVEWTDSAARFKVNAEDVYQTSNDPAIMLKPEDMKAAKAKGASPAQTPAKPTARKSGNSKSSGSSQQSKGTLRVTPRNKKTTTPGPKTETEEPKSRKANGDKKKAASRRIARQGSTKSHDAADDDDDDDAEMDDGDDDYEDDEGEGEEEDDDEEDDDDDDDDDDESLSMVMDVEDEEDGDEEYSDGKEGSKADAKMAREARPGKQAETSRKTQAAGARGKPLRREASDASSRTSQGAASASGKRRAQAQDSASGKRARTADSQGASISSLEAARASILAPELAKPINALHAESHQRLRQMAGYLLKSLNATQLKAVSALQRKRDVTRRDLENVIKAANARECEKPNGRLAAKKLAARVERLIFQAGNAGDIAVIMDSKKTARAMAAYDSVAEMAKISFKHGRLCYVQDMDTKRFIKKKLEPKVQFTRILEELNSGTA